MKSIAFSCGSLIGLALLGPFLGGCFGDDSTEGLEGTLNNACYPNSGTNPGLCQTPLVCVRNTCIAPTGTGGTDASGGSSLDASSAPPDATTMDDSSNPSSDGGSIPDATQGMDATQSMDSSGLVNVVTNGDFSMGTTGGMTPYWSIVSGNGTLMANNGMGCVSVGANQTATLGWPEAPATTGTPIVAADSYTLEYTAFTMTGGNVSIDAKVGQTSGQYLSDFETGGGTMNPDPVTPTATPFTHTFNPENGDDPSAGIAFMIPQTGTVTAATIVCFQNVSLIQN